MAVEGNILRQTQVVTTFGPGSLVDLPKQSVIVGGLDDWKMNGRRRIQEEGPEQHGDQEVAIGARGLLDAVVDERGLEAPVAQNLQPEPEVRARDAAPCRASRASQRCRGRRTQALRRRGPHW